MASFVLEDLEADIEVTLFPRTLPSTATSSPTTSIVAVSGRLDKRDEDRVNVICQDIEVLTGLEDGPAPTLTLRIPEVRLGPRELDPRSSGSCATTRATRPSCSTSAARRSA